MAFAVEFVFRRLDWTRTVKSHCHGILIHVKTLIPWHFLLVLGDLNLLKNKTYFLNTYNEFKKSYASKLEHWYLGITLYLPMKMKGIAKEKYFLITKNCLPEKEQLEKFWEYERDLDYQFNVFAKKLRDYLQDHYIKLEKTFHQTFTHNTNSTIDLTLFKIIRREVITSESPYTGDMDRFT